MPYRSQSTAEPAKVTLEVCPDKTLVWLTDNVEEVQQEEQTVYEYDELVFALPEDRHESPCGTRITTLLPVILNKQMHERRTGKSNLKSSELKNLHVFV